MSYIVIKTVKGRRYRYEQRTWREGKRVRTESLYLGPVDGGARAASKARPRRRKGLIAKVRDLIAANTLSAEERARIVDEEAILKGVKAREAERRASIARFEANTGLRMGPAKPVPEDKPASSIDPAGAVSTPQTDPGVETESPTANAAGQEVSSE